MELKKTGKPIVLILSNGRPLELCRLEPVCDAIVEIWQPGIAGGKPLAGILTGRINPSGKLPITFPYATGQIPIYYNQRKSGRSHQGFYQDITSKPLYPFGHGLSYTAFDYAVENAKMDADRCELKVSVKNIGKVAGREAVQLYVKAPNGGLDKPAKELKAFGKTALLQPGESQTLILTWNVMDMASFNEKNSSWELAKGEYQWMVAASSADVRCTAVQRVTKARKQKVHDAMRAQVPVAVYPMVKR